jgi:hypothetical protein
MRIGFGSIRRRNGSAGVISVVPRGCWDAEVWTGQAGDFGLCAVMNVDEWANDAQP